MQLSRPAIVAAALEILDQYGFADMTMRRVATHLSVAPGALYWHVANKQELISAIAEGIVAEVGIVDKQETPLELAAAFRTRLLAHRDGAELVTAAMSQPHSPVHGAVVARFRDALVAAFPSLDDDSPDLDAVAAGMVNLTLGATLLYQSGKQYAEITGEDFDGTAHADAMRAVELLISTLGQPHEAR